MLCREGHLILPQVHDTLGAAYVVDVKFKVMMNMTSSGWIYRDTLRRQQTPQKILTVLVPTAKKKRWVHPSDLTRLLFVSFSILTSFRNFAFGSSN